MIKEYKKPTYSGDYLVTIAIGEPYLSEWESFALPSWVRYSEIHGLGILAITEDLIDIKHKHWKKPQWQKLLIGEKVITNFPKVGNLCYLDTDILLNPFAPNIFDYYNGKSYGLVSIIKNLPMSLDLVNRQYSFLRNQFYSSSYPLDSAVFMSAEDQYKFSGLKPLDDLCCTGLILFNPKVSAAEMKNWFYKYDPNYLSITGGEQVHINWEMLNTNNVQWLPYQFQAIWVYEMAWKYPFLYNKRDNTSEIIRNCIEASLFSNYFLHFAGSWFESDMWTIGGIMEDKESLELNRSFKEYLKTPVTGSPVGFVKPKS